MCSSLHLVVHTGSLNKRCERESEINVVKILTVLLHVVIRVVISISGRHLKGEKVGEIRLVNPIIYKILLTVGKEEELKRLSE